MITSRPVTVEIVYDGDTCSRDCPFFGQNDDITWCNRNRNATGIDEPMRTDECRAEDRIDDIMLGNVPALTPEQVVALEKEMQESMSRLRKHVWEEIDKTHKEWEARFKK